MTRKHLLRLAALAQGAAVISVAGCNQTPSVSAPTSDGPGTSNPPPINAPAPLPSTATAADSANAADASSPDAATAYRPHPPYINAPPRPLSSGFNP